MVLTLKHFDNRLNQWIHKDGDSNNPDSILVEELKNSLLEAYFPNGQFSISTLDEKSIATDLYNHPDDHILLLSSKSRLVYGPREYLKKIEELCPDRKDRGAYGSLFLGGCSKAVTKTLNVLVVDDSNGENGGVISNDLAWRQVGDCHGKISPTLARELSGTSEQVIQHRLGFLDQNRFAKGTFAPKDLSYLPGDIDLIIPTSSFKGGDKQNNPISPGIHNVKVWLGAKDLSPIYKKTNQPRKIAISQLLASFPSGMRDYIKSLEEQASRLKKLQNDPRSLALYYCQKYDLRSLEKEESVENEQKEESLMYRIIKADLEGHGQLLETQKIRNELSRFLRKEWLSIAIGKSINIDRGMIIPSKDLKNGEICVPWLPPGEEILNFRSPLLNSNGVCISTNKYVEDAYSPDGRPLLGTIVVNDEDHARIKARIAEQKAKGIVTNEIDPVETESERQGRDYDGDCIGVALASSFPYLTAEAKLRARQENAYAPVIKEDKVSFIFPDGSQPPMEEIAIHMSDQISVGVINNHATAVEALESEIDILRSIGTFEMRKKYITQVGEHYQNLLEIATDPLKPIPIPPLYEARISAIAKIAAEPLTNQSISEALTINRSIYHDMVSFAGYQNQLGVDIFKSNRKPDRQVIENNNRLLHRIPNYIRDKKKPEVYLNSVISPTGYSPVELILAQTNKIFNSSQLEARPTQQFRDLFPAIYTPTQYNNALLVKHRFDLKFNLAVAYNNKIRAESGPVLKVTTAKGNELEITNLTRFNHPNAFGCNRLDLKLVEAKNKSYHKLIAQSPVNVDGETRWLNIGTVCELSRANNSLKAGLKTSGATVANAALCTEFQVRSMFFDANAIASKFRDSISPEELQQMAAATWHLCTTESHKKFDPNNNYKISNFAFAAFPEEIIEQLKELQLTNLTVTGLTHPPITDNQLVNIAIGRPSPTNSEEELQQKRLLYVQKEGNYLPLGVVATTSAMLPIGTFARAFLEPLIPATATLKITGIDTPITIGKMGDFDFTGKIFNGEIAKVTLEKSTLPPLPLLKLDDKIIGELDAQSVSLLENARQLKPGVALDVTLNTMGIGNGTSTLATTNLGNTIRVTRHNSYNWKNHRFDEHKATVTIDFKERAPVMAVKLDGEGFSGLAGYFTQKPSISVLQKANLFYSGSTFEANVTSNVNVAKVIIAPDSVQYPPTNQWVKQNNTQLNYLTPSRSPLTASDTLVKKLFLQPTLFHRWQTDGQLVNGEHSKLCSLGLSVDRQIASRTESWLLSHQIPFQIISEDYPSIEPETERGYVVFQMQQNDLTR